jgi:hypothetical protein
MRTIAAAKVSMGSQQLVTGTVSDSEGQEVKKQRPYGRRNPDAVIEERQRRLYRRQLEGLTTRQLVLDHASRESISEKTAWMDWRVVSKWNEEDWSKDREALLSRLQGMRFRAINAALKRGQLQTAAALMDSVGKVLNESGLEQQAAAAPTLNITVDDRRNRE